MEGSCMPAAPASSSRPCDGPSASHGEPLLQMLDTGDGERGVALCDFDGCVYGAEYLSFVKQEPLMKQRCSATVEGWAWGRTDRPGGENQFGWFPPTYWRSSAHAGPASGGMTSAPVLALWQQCETVDAPQSIQEFLSRYGLESWVGEALEILTDTQRKTVFGPSFRMHNVKNPNTIVLSRIGDVATLRQRLAIFARINGISQLILERLSAESPMVQEAIMEWPRRVKIAGNVRDPCGIVMSRLRAAMAAELAKEHGQCDTAGNKTVEQLVAELAEEQRLSTTLETALKSVCSELDRLRALNEMLTKKLEKLMVQVT